MCKLGFRELCQACYPPLWASQVFRSTMIGCRGNRSRFEKLPPGVEI